MKERGNRFPRMEESVLFEEMVLTAIAGNFKLRAGTERTSFSLCHADRSLDVSDIRIKVHSPLAKVTRRYFHELLHGLKRSEGKEGERVCGKRTEK